MNPKLMLLLFGALMLIGAACANGNGPPSPLSIADKRRVIRNMLEAQKDIRQALIKIRRQIQGDLNSTGHNGAAGDDSDEDDIDEEMGGDGFGDMSGEEEEGYFKEQQKKIREAREKLEATVKNIAASLVAIKEHVEKIDRSVDEAIRASRNKDYNLYYHSKPGQHGGDRPEQPKTTPSSSAFASFVAKPPSGYGGFGYGYSYESSGNFKDTLGQSSNIAGKQSEDEPFQPIVGTGSGKKNKKPSRTYRTRKSLDGTIPTVDAEQLSSPDIPSIVGYEGPVQKTVEFQQNQQQVE